MAAIKPVARALAPISRPTRPMPSLAVSPSRRHAWGVAAGASVRRPLCPRPAAAAAGGMAQQPGWWWSLGGGGPGRGARSIFIQTETTPNQDALKFLPNHRVLPESLSIPFVEYLSARSTVAPPHPSPLAARLMAIDGVAAVFYGPDFITVTKAADAQWAHIRPETFALITEAVTSGEAIISPSERREAEAGGGGSGDATRDSLAYDEHDSEVVGMIKELLETRIRPAIQEDGGDIEYRGFDDGYVRLKLRGACRTCDSSTVTLKNGIEGMLMHYVEEVKGVHQVLDQEEEIAAQEFAKFEEKLKARHGSEHAAQTQPGT